jgi:hypothetical protein
MTLTAPSTCRLLLLDACCVSLVSTPTRSIATDTMVLTTRLRPLPLPLLGCAREALEQSRAPAAPSGDVAPMTVVVVVVVVVVSAVVVVVAWWSRVVVVSRPALPINDAEPPTVGTRSSMAPSACSVLHQVQVHDDAESQAVAGRWWCISFVDQCCPANNGQPSYLWDVGRIHFPGPEIERSRVLLPQGLLFNIVQGTSSCHCSLGDVLILGVERNTL